jgi:hypothetical protein
MCEALGQIPSTKEEKTKNNETKNLKLKKTLNTISILTVTVMSPWLAFIKVFI